MEFPSRPQRPHIPALDGLRGLAVALVLFQHFFHGIAKGTSLADDVVFGLASRSWMGVDLFFVLSGFLITGILVQDKGSPGFYRNFYARRALRIFPAYYALLAIVYLALPRTGIPEAVGYAAASSGDQVWHWTYLSNFRIAWNEQWYLHHVPNVFWSLAIEEQFYLIWPLVVVACSQRTLARLCAALFALALGLRFYLAWRPDVNWISSFVLTPTRMDGLVLGALLAILMRRSKDPAALRHRAWAALAMSFAPLAALTLTRPPAWRELPIQSLRFSAVAIFFGALLWLAVTARPGSLLQRGFASRPLVVLGKYSYALYLWHGPVDYLTRQLFDPNRYDPVWGSKLPAQALYVAIAASLSMGAALASWHLLERHVLRWKRAFAGEPAKARES